MVDRETEILVSVGFTTFYARPVQITGLGGGFTV